MQNYEVIIIGSGFSGICAAIKLQEIGIQNFVILERDQELGGTWWKNSYPGAAVDVPSRLYSFSFEPYTWSRLFAKRDEIYDYTKKLISKYQLRKSSRLNVSIEKLSYQEDSNTWKLLFQDGTEIQSKFIFTATGALSQINIPNITGIDQFKGSYCHTSEWDHNFDFNNKKVSVIGTGASGVQLIPELAKIAKQLNVLQRTAHWILPRPDRALKKWEQSLLSNKVINKLFRGITYLKSETRAIFFTKFPSIAKIVKLEGLHHLKKQVKDEGLQKKLRPKFEIGCKRVLLTNDYYPSLSLPNVHLETEAIDYISETGIVLKNGKELDSDYIVFATGFHASEKAIPFDIIGRENTSIQAYWKDGAFAYYGTSLSMFPNLFMGMGPNTGTGHTSVIYFIESQMNYFIDAIQKSKKGNWKSFEIKKEIETAYNKKIQSQLKKSIWQVGGCKSWYLTDSGINTTMFPNFSFVFRKNTKIFEESAHIIKT